MFEQFDLDSELLANVKALGYKKPTSIQELVIPKAMMGKDILASAPTGTGKTAAFSLPIINKFGRNRINIKAKSTRSLILTPTRELASQIMQNIDDYAEGLELKTKVVYGGVGRQPQVDAIAHGLDILVATPGRLLDLIAAGDINFSALEVFVLDEADKMLDFGFEEELELLLQVLPKKRQNLLFSATYPAKMLNIASKITQNPIEISIENEETTVQSINQRVIEVNKENRSALLRHLIKEEKWEQVLVFMANKRSCDNIASKFRKYGFEAESFHGDLVQEERNETLEDFKSKKIKVLFATDIAARGLHIDNISCVVNYDLPRAAADYIHRIGRTGRAGKSGIAVSFISHEDKEHFALIEKRSNINLEKEQISGFELTGTPITKEKGLPPVKGKRKSKKDKLREESLKKTK